LIADGTHSIRKEHSSPDNRARESLGQQIRVRSTA
jgi:hypothetical protein